MSFQKIAPPPASFLINTGQVYRFRMAYKPSQIERWKIVAFDHLLIHVKTASDFSLIPYAAIVEIMKSELQSDTDLT